MNGSEQESCESALDSTVVQKESAEIHAQLIEVEAALREGHEARAALLLSDCIEQMSDLTSKTQQL